MVVSKSGIPDREAAFEKRARFGTPSLLPAKKRQAMQTVGDVAVVGAENPLSNCQRAHGGRLRVCIASLLAVEHR